MAVARLELQVDDKGTIKVKQLGEELKKTGEDAKRAQAAIFQGIGQGVGQKMFDGLLSSLKSFTMGALQAQSDQLAAINSLNLALANQGNLLPGVSQDLQNYASHLMDVSTFSDDAIEKAMALGASFGMMPDQLKAATQAAADLSAATGKGLDESMTLLGKALAGNVTGLQKLGLHFTEGASGAKKMEEAVAQLEGRYKGAAEAATQTFAGGLEQLKNQTGETQEALGKLFGELAGGDRPFSMATDAARGMATFFGSTLVVALSELRATFSETMANIAQAGGLLMELIAHWLDSAGKLPIVGEKFKELAESLRGGASFLDEFSKGMNTAAAAQREAGNQAATTAGKTQEYVNQQKKAAEEATKAAAAAKAHAEALKHQQEALKNVVAGLKAHNDELAKSLAAQAALLGMLGPSVQDATTQMGELASSMEAWGGASELSDAQLTKLIGDMQQQIKLGGDNAMGWEAYSAALQEATSRGLAAGQTFETLATHTHHVATEAEKAQKAMELFEAKLGHVIREIGMIAGSLGLENLANGAEAALGFMDEFDKAAADSVITWGEMAQLTASIVQGFKQATDSASALSRALGGAMVGAAAGEKIGALFGPIGAAIGAAGGAIIGAIAGIFHKPEWAKVADEAGKVLGTHISKALAEEIMKTSKDLHISIDASALLHLTDAIKESGKAATTFFPQMQQLLAGVAHGTIPAAQGVEALGSAFEMLQKEAEAGSVAAQQQIVHDPAGPRGGRPGPPDHGRGGEGHGGRAQRPGRLHQELQDREPGGRAGGGADLRVRVLGGGEGEGRSRPRPVAMLPAWQAMQEALARRPASTLPWSSPSPGPMHGRLRRAGGRGRARRSCRAWTVHRAR
jgi:hypothetical protein